MQQRRHVLGAGAVLMLGAWMAGCAGSMAYRDRSIAGPAGRLHVDDGGRGTAPPVLFVHSFAGSSQHWSAQLAHLRESRRAVAMDLRGHGRSDAPAGAGYTVPELAGDIAAVADALALERFVLVGHSMGGVAASEYARTRPHRVAGLVLVGTPGLMPTEQVRQTMTALRADYEKTSEVYWQRLLTGAQPQNAALIRREVQRMPRDMGLPLISALFAYDPRPALQAYPGPVLLIDTPQADGPGALHLQAPNLPRAVITGTSHWPHMDRPVEFDRVLDEFLVVTSG